MPHFRGIEVSVHASLGALQVVEYPHPDGSSVCLLRGTAPPAIRNAPTGITTGGESRPSDPATADDVDPTRLKKVNPRISVYIPSLPGEQFWLRYHITQSPPPSRCIFFKMTMNGRHISSWGINTSTHSTGVVVRALYRPEARWGDACGYNESRYPGIETRYFHFMPGLDEKSVADDGGIIEVQVFRCKGRKRIALELDAYRNQERYGITSPSGGLVDNPEDATYYNYYLVDAKDAPYATFCFHYRSMKYLRQLNLAPQVGLDLPSTAKHSADTRQEESTELSGSVSTSPPAQSFAFDAATQGSQVFEDDISTIEREEVEEIEIDEQRDFLLKSPPELPSVSAQDTVANCSVGDLERHALGAAQQRPLPDIPNNQTRPTSASSLRSNCPSLTPSLRQYVDSEDFENEEIRISMAQPMLISSESMQGLELVHTGPEEGRSFSDYASSPSSTEASDSPDLPSPAGYIATTGSVLERHLTQFDSPNARSPPSEAQSSQSCGTDGAVGRSRVRSGTGVLTLSEAQWLRRTPSPVQRDTHPVSCADEAVGALEAEIRGVALDGHTVERHVDATGQSNMAKWI
ncbi:hypothetical protein F4777DRAFT_601719 [Nemania sp. FL0916]|nr:hypothetical protein F4777DRAFT_601719 [Nemania sp. FL0916]